jgi:tRNA 2-thiouridine synthesizing protein A
VSDEAKDTTAADVVWDAGDLACGVLLLRLRGRMEAMRPGQVLRLVAQDLGAAEDMPAWCRLTGHTLLSAAPPVYLIRRKDG